MMRDIDCSSSLRIVAEGRNMADGVVLLEMTLSLYRRKV